MRPAGNQLLVDPGREGVKLRLAVVAPGNSRLVRYDEDEDATVVGPLDRLASTVNPTEVLGPVDPAKIDVQRAIAVEKKGRLHQDTDRQRICSRSSQIVWPMRMWHS